MTKRILSVLAMMSIAAMMMLSSCTAAGVECGLIGKWENEKNGVKTTVEITADDKLTVTAKYDGKTLFENKGTIKSVSGKEITYEVDGIESKIKYSDLGCDTVKFGDIEYKKVY